MRVQFVSLLNYVIFISNMNPANYWLENSVPGQMRRRPRRPDAENHSLQIFSAYIKSLEVRSPRSAEKID